jgi:hypothetical protein
VLLSVGLCAAAYYGFLSRAESVNIFLVAALVLVTTVYAKESERSRKAMEEQRHSGVMPIMVADAWLRNLKTEDQTQGISVCLSNIGPGPALDVGVSIVDATPSSVEKAWTEGKTVGISFLQQFNLAELAAGDDMSSNPKELTLPLLKNSKFIIVSECSHIHGGVIGAYREYRVLEGEQGGLLLKSTGTVSAQKVNHRIRTYP